MTAPEGYLVRSLAYEFADAAERGLDREQLAERLHDLLCHDDHEVEGQQWNPTPGGHNRYQRHADALLGLGEFLTEQGLP